MGWHLVWIFLDRLVDHFWWLLGIVFMVEPWIDAHVEAYRDWAEKYVSRQARARIAWTVSLVCLFVASSWAFSDEYWSHQGDLKALSASQQQYAAQKQRATDLDNSIRGKGGLLDQIDMLKARVAEDDRKPPKTIIQRVPSGTQGPIKDRSAVLGPLQKFYAEAGALQVRLLRRDIPDDQIDAIERATNSWLNVSADWIGAHMGDAARSRFLNNTDKVSYVFELSGTHKTGEKDKRDNILDSLAGCMTNLETLMKSDEFDRQH